MSSISEQASAQEVGDISFGVMISDLALRRRILSAYPGARNVERIVDSTTCVVADSIDVQIGDASRSILFTKGGPRANYVDAVLQGRFAAVVTSGDISDIAFAIEAIERGYLVLARDDVTLARRIDGLSKRQLDVLVALLDGASNLRIAHRLGVSVATVKREVTTLLTRFACSSRTDLALTAQAMGLGLHKSRD